MADAADNPAIDIGAAIQRGVELLAQQSVETPTFKLASIADLYREGVRAVKSRAPAARVLEAWSDATAEMPAPLPMAIERAISELENPAVADQYWQRTTPQQQAAWPKRKRRSSPPHWRPRRRSRCRATAQERAWPWRRWSTERNRTWRRQACLLTATPLTCG